MKTLKIVFLTFLIFLSAFFNINVFAQESTSAASPSAAVTSYELFWPITAGRTMGDSFYWLKQLKESIRGFFIFGDLRKATYNLELSNKRVVESEKLYLETKDYFNGKKTLEEAKLKRDQAVKLLIDAYKSKKPVNTLMDQFKSNLEKQKILLDLVKLKVVEQQKVEIEQEIEFIKTDLDTIQSSF